MVTINSQVSYLKAVHFFKTKAIDPGGNAAPVFFLLSKNKIRELKPHLEQTCQNQRKYSLRRRCQAKRSKDNRLVKSINKYWGLKVHANNLKTGQKLQNCFYPH